jgi:hypothetical protein
MIERLGKTCFSTKPVAKCPSGTVPTKYQQNTVEVYYRCLSNNDQRLQELVQSAESNSDSSSSSSSASSESKEIQEQLQKMQPTVTQRERAPKRCQQA